MNHLKHDDRPGHHDEINAEDWPIDFWMLDDEPAPDPRDFGFYDPFDDV